MLLRAANRRTNVQLGRQSNYPGPARRIGKVVQLIPRPKSNRATESTSLLESRFGQLLSTLLHGVAVTSFSLIGGCAWDFLLMSGFNMGMLLGLTTYGILLVVSVTLETKINTLTNPYPEISAKRRNMSEADRLALMVDPW